METGSGVFPAGFWKVSGRSLPAPSIIDEPHGKLDLLSLGLEELSVLELEERDVDEELELQLPIKKNICFV